MYPRPFSLVLWRGPAAFPDKLESTAGNRAGRYDNCRFIPATPGRCAFIGAGVAGHQLPTVVLGVETAHTLRPPRCHLALPGGRTTAAVPTERIAARYTKKQYWYSGKHQRHGGAVQTVAAPDGELLWVSGVLPGRMFDITAARRFEIAEKVTAFLGLLAHLGLHPEVITGYKRQRGQKTLPEAKKAANRTQAALRCLGERANAQLRYWRVQTTGIALHPACRC